MLVSGGAGRYLVTVQGLSAERGDTIWTLLNPDPTALGKIEIVIGGCLAEYDELILVDLDDALKATKTHF